MTEKEGVQLPVRSEQRLARSELIPESGKASIRFTYHEVTCDPRTGKTLPETEEQEKEKIDQIFSLFSALVGESGEFSNARTRVTNDGGIWSCVYTDIGCLMSITPLPAEFEDDQRPHWQLRAVVLPPDRTLRHAIISLVDHPAEYGQRLDIRTLDLEQYRPPEESDLDGDEELPEDQVNSEEPDSDLSDDEFFRTSPQHWIWSSYDIALEPIIEVLQDALVGKVGNLGPEKVLDDRDYYDVPQQEQIIRAFVQTCQQYPKQMEKAALRMSSFDVEYKDKIGARRERGRLDKLSKKVAGNLQRMFSWEEGSIPRWNIFCFKGNFNEAVRIDSRPSYVLKSAGNLVEDTRAFFKGRGFRNRQRGGK